MDTNNLIESIDARGGVFVAPTRHFPLFFLFIQIPLICLAGAFRSVCDIISVRDGAGGKGECLFLSRLL